MANVTSIDLAEFLPIAGEIPLQVEVEEYALEEANEALVALRSGHVRGAKVLKISSVE